MKCGNCGGSGRISVLNPVTRQPMGDKPCELCEGTGELPDEINYALAMQKLDTIISLLENLIELAKQE